MKKVAISIIFTMVVALSACGTIGFKDVSVEEAKKLIDNGEVTVLDVRTPEEYEEGHIPGSMLIPLQELGERLDELDEEEPYLIVCRSGNRSAEASELLIGEGFPDVYNMTGGMNDWVYELEY